MNRDLVNDITRQIQRKFPEFSGVRPKVQKQNATAGTYVLTFSTRVEVTGGKKLSRSVRVVANGQGKILKISTSR